MNTPRVAVTGLGFITCLGHDSPSVSQRLHSGQHGFSRVELRPGLDLPIKLVGAVPGYHFPSPIPQEWDLPAHSAVSSEEAAALPPHVIYAIDALEQALAQAGLTHETVGSPETGLFAASAGSPFLLNHHLRQYEERHWRRGHPLGVVQSIAGTLPFHLVARHGIRGASGGFVSACTSSSHALGYAHDEIALGRQTRMLVVGAEECFVENVIPFDAMRALTANPDPDTACRPFDRKRDGFIVAGGAVAIILERADLARGEPLAFLRAWGQASDGYHVASPHPEGAGLHRAMRRALDASGIACGEIDYVNAHATSTQAGDRAEALALARLFGPAAERPAIVSTKGLTGHGLSLSGILEATLTVLSIHQGFLPANRNLECPDEACGDLPYPTEVNDRAAVHAALNNSSGFGGSNVCHVFTKT